MFATLDREQAATARELAADRLLRQRTPAGIWPGRPSGSPLATAAALCALALAEQHVDDQPEAGAPGHDSWLSGVLYRAELNELVMNSLRWLAERQRDDGGWGDSADSHSTLRSTVMVLSAFRLTAVPAKFAGLRERAEAYVAAQGGVDALRTETPPTAAAVTNRLVHSAAAAAGLTPWRRTKVLRPEEFLARRLWHGATSDDRCAAPAAALGLAKARQAPARNPAARTMRRLLAPRATVAVVAGQTPTGDFTGSPLLTSLTLIGLIHAGGASQAAVRKGAEFLLGSARGQGCWPLETDRSVRHTAAAASALDWNFTSESDNSGGPSAEARTSLQWLLSQRRRDDNTCGEGWSDGAAATTPQPEATALVLRALARWRERWPYHSSTDVEAALQGGRQWLISRQQGDGGWRRCCCCGGGSEREGEVGVTAAILASLAGQVASQNPRSDGPGPPSLAQATEAAHRFLLARQTPDGSWRPPAPGEHDDSIRQLSATAQAAAWLVARREDAPDAAALAVAWLAKRMATDWRDDLYATATAISALADWLPKRPELSPVVAAGAACLSAAGDVQQCAAATDLNPEGLRVSDATTTAIAVAAACRRWAETTAADSLAPVRATA